MICLTVALDEGVQTRLLIVLALAWAVLDRLAKCSSRHQLVGQYPGFRVQLEEG